MPRIDIDIRTLRFLIAATLASIALFLTAAAPRASAAPELGLMSGVNAWQEPSQWDVMEKSGVSVYRLMVNNQANWATLYDNAFTYAAERNIKILPYLYNFNGSQQFPTKAVYEKEGSGSWKEWVETVVRRYGYSGKFWSEHPSLPYKPVTAWEVWNEPNRKENNPGGATVQAQNYAEFMRHTSYIIKAAQQAQSGGGTQVLFGGLYSPHTSSKNGSGQYTKMSVADFLQVAHITGLGEHFDGLSVHPYGFAVEKLAKFKSHVQEARTALNNYSSSKTLWLTEVGWPVGASSEIYVNEAEQAVLLTESFDWAEANSASMKIENITWYTYRDHPGALGSWADYCGLRKNGVGAAFRPAWYRLQEQTGEPLWPVIEWHMDNLGGNIASDPDIASWGYGRLDVFAKGPNNELLHRAYNAGWAPWENFGGTLASGPSAVSWGPNRVDVVARGTKDQVLHWAWNGSAWVFDEPLSGKIYSDPDISTRGYGILDIFARGSSNELIHTFYMGGWKPWENLGGTLYAGSGPGAVSWSPNRMDVVARATNNTVAHWAWNEVAWPFDNLGGNITSDPDIASRGIYDLHVFARGASNQLVHKGYTGSNWGQWENLPGGPLASGPGAVAWDKERMDVVARASDNSVAHWAYTLALPQ